MGGITHGKSAKSFANWIRTNFRRQETLKILLSDEKMFDIDGVYNTQMIVFEL
jgi:hypothetical protein